LASVPVCTRPVDVEHPRKPESAARSKALGVSYVISDVRPAVVIEADTQKAVDYAAALWVTVGPRAAALLSAAARFQAWAREALAIDAVSVRIARVFRALRVGLN
jgi:hypothetical protein